MSDLNRIVAALGHGDIGDPRRHSVRTERGNYIMGPAWIDTVHCSEYADYDFTMTFRELHERDRLFREANQ